MQIPKTREETEALEGMIAQRRDFHAHPEEGWCEFRTTAAIVRVLENLGFAVLTGEDVIAPDARMGVVEERLEAARHKALEEGADATILDRMGDLTGCVGVWKTGRPGPVTALRFDIDALRGVTESSSPEHRPAALGFASPVPNVCHACGHDAHTAVGLGVARWIASHAHELTGTVKLLFQPAEEGVRGAAAMAKSGVVDDCGWLFGSHVGCEFGPDELGILEEGYLATTKMDVFFEGTPAHAGSDPEKGRSALLAACAAVMSIQGLPRHSGGDSRVSIGRIEAGEGRNVVAAHGRLELEVRGATKEVNDFLADEVHRIVHGMAEVYGVKGKVVKTGESCRYVCDPEAVAILEDVAKALPDKTKATVFTTERGSEDCAVLAERVRSLGGKAGFFCFGTRHKGHHRPDFDVEDEDAMLLAWRVFTGVLARLHHV